MIDHNQKALIELVKSSLFNITTEIPDDTDWDEVLREAEAQTIAGIVADVFPNVEAKKNWKNVVIKTKADFLRIIYGQKEIIQLFESSNIPLVILKGIAAAQYYPKPYLRTMGDVDILVPQEKFEQAAIIMEENGYLPLQSIRYLPNTQIKPRHVSFQRNGILYELHHHFSKNGIDIERSIIQGLKHSVKVSIGGNCFPVLPHIENGLALLAHISYHLILSGLGLRHVLDWMMFVDCELNDEIWENEFRVMVEEAGLEKLAICLTKLCKDYLGLSKSCIWCENADEETVNSLLSLILERGNFGHKMATPRKLENLVANIKTRGFIPYLGQTGEMVWSSQKVQTSKTILQPFLLVKELVRMVMVRIFSNPACWLEEAKEADNLSKLFRELGLK